MNYKEDIKAMCLHSFCIRKMEGVHFNPSSPLSSSVLTPVKSLSHQVRQIAFQRLLPAANGESGAGQAAAGSRGRQQVPNTCGTPEFPVPRTRTGQAAVGRGLFPARALDGAGGTLPRISMCDPGQAGQLDVRCCWGIWGRRYCQCQAIWGCRRMSKSWLREQVWARKAESCRVCPSALSSRVRSGCRMPSAVQGTCMWQRLWWMGKGRNSTVLSMADKGW